MRVDQRAARIAGIHGRVGLDKGLDAEIVGNNPQITRLGAHDTRRNGRLQVERRTDRQHPLAQTQRIGRSESQRRQVRSLDLQQREVRGRILADQLGVERTAVVELHAEFRSPVHDVVVGHHVTVGRDDDARTSGALFAELRSLVIPLRDAEELQKGIVPPAARHLDLLHGFDIDHGLHRILGGVRQVGVLLGLIRGELRPQRGRAFHLALDILYGAFAAPGYCPCRKSARGGRYGDCS